MYLPDFIESLESSCERWYDENVNKDIMTCSCGQKCKLDEAETVSSNPYSIPVCPICFEKFLEENNG